jgi:hypothetical protein
MMQCFDTSAGSVHRSAQQPYTESALWKAADTFCREVAAMTCGFAEYHTFIRLLREKAAALPVAVAAIYASDPADPREIRRAYEIAHDAEYVLFCAHLFRNLPYEATAGLYGQVHEVKRLIVTAERESPYGRN